MKIELLGKSRAGEILLFVYNNGNKAYFSQISNNIKGSTSTINSGIYVLEKEGLVFEEVENKFGGKRYIFLTEKGKKVAVHLAEIEKIMEGENEN